VGVVKDIKSDGLDIDGVPHIYVSLYQDNSKRLSVVLVALAGVGLVAGLVVSASTASVTARVLYGVRPHDPAVFLIVPLLLFAIAVLASYLPARRATEVDLISAFREG
jgi:ABC-type antimicrobial peptide transport system permease subunit